MILKNSLGRWRIQPRAAFRYDMKLFLCVYLFFIFYSPPKKASHIELTIFELNAAPPPAPNPILTC